MDEQLRSEETARLLLSRREVLGGGLMLGLLALSGCAGGGNRPLPNPNFAVGTPTVKPYVPPPSTPVTPAPQPVAGNLVMMPRGAWTRAGIRSSNINPMNGVSRITVHHEGMEPFTSTAQDVVARRIESVRQAHMQRRAKTGERWADIGYHYIIDPAGRVWEGRGTQYQGAHVQDENEHNLGVMVLGNFERQRPTGASTATLDAFVAQQMRRYGVPRGRVYTHRELNPTSCPGSSLQSYMVKTRSRGGRLAMICSELKLA